MADFLYDLIDAVLDLELNEDESDVIIGKIHSKLLEIDK